MTDKDETPLRGEAAWKALKKDIAKRNDAAHARGQQQRSDADDAARDRQRDAARKEAQSLPTQPGRD